MAIMGMHMRPSLCAPTVPQHTQRQASDGPLLCIVHANFEQLGAHIQDLPQSTAVTSEALRRASRAQARHADSCRTEAGTSGSSAQESPTAAQHDMCAHSCRRQPILMPHSTVCIQTRVTTTHMHKLGNDSRKCPAQEGPQTLCPVPHTRLCNGCVSKAFSPEVGYPGQQHTAVHSTTPAEKVRAAHSVQLPDLLI
jgi:hypothetical protein